MCPEKQKELKLKYAHLFGTERTPFNCWGFEFDDGWTELVENLLAELDKYSKENNIKIRILSAKEKFGNLRVYLGAIEDTGLNDKTFDEIFRIIEKYEELSKKTCEITGKPGQLSEKNGWLKTLSVDKARELGYILVNKPPQSGA